ncbi:MAG: hypothetical protein ACREMQ_03720, partial [Longimicrobiales bacterium]
HLDSEVSVRALIGIAVALLAIACGDHSVQDGRAGGGELRRDAGPSEPPSVSTMGAQQRRFLAALGDSTADLAELVSPSFRLVDDSDTTAAGPFRERSFTPYGGDYFAFVSRKEAVNIPPSDRFEFHWQGDGSVAVVSLHHDERPSITVWENVGGAWKVRALVINLTDRTLRLLRDIGQGTG